MITVTTIRKAAQQLLEDRLPAALAAAAVVELPEKLQEWAREPRTWKRLPDFRALKADQSPAVVVASPGFAASPQRAGDGEWNLSWLLNTFCCVRGPTPDETADLVGLYVACARKVLLTNSIAVEGASRARLRGEAYDLLDTDAARSIGAGVVVVSIPVRGVQLEEAEPIAPFGGEVETTIVSVTAMEE